MNKLIAKKNLLVYYIISIILDLMSTYFSTPDLAREGAWDYKLLNIGWRGLILLSIFYLIITWIIFLKFTDKNKFPKYIKNEKIKVWGSRFVWMMIINFTIAYYLAAFSNFLYCFEYSVIDNKLLQTIISLHTSTNQYLYDNYSIIYIDIIAFFSTIVVFFVVKKQIN